MLPSERNAHAVPVRADPVAEGEQSAGEAEIDSLRLLQGRRELLIRHGGECYRLRHTRNDKLILTK
jgi:hemin uptake protein HemP